MQRFNWGRLIKTISVTKNQSMKYIFFQSIITHVSGSDWQCINCVPYCSSVCQCYMFIWSIKVISFDVTHATYVCVMLTTNHANNFIEKWHITSHYHNWQKNTVHLGQFPSIYYKSPFHTRQKLLDL